MTELTDKIEECNELHQEIKLRPLKVVAKAELNTSDNHPHLTNKMQDCLNKGVHFYCKLKVDGQYCWVMPIKEDEQLFYGTVFSHFLHDTISQNDLIQFQSADVFEFNYSQPRTMQKRWICSQIVVSSVKGTSVEVHVNVRNVGSETKEEAIGKFVLATKEAGYAKKLEIEAIELDDLRKID